ncbi:hypothetical protein MCEMIE22_02565 [Mycobacteriaceae bacterium]
MESWIPPEIEGDMTAELDVPRGGFFTSPLTWFATRDEALALAATALALDPNALANPRLPEMASELDYAGIRGILEVDCGNVSPRARVYDFCSGVGTLAAAAAALDCESHAVEIEPVAALVNRVINTYAADPAIARPSEDGNWGGLSRELDEAANRIRRVIVGAVAGREEVAVRSETMVGRLWAWYCRCSGCGRNTPIIIDAGVTDDLTLSVLTGGRPQLVRTKNSERYRTWYRGRLSCVHCLAHERIRPGESGTAAPLLDLMRDDQGKLEPRVLQRSTVLDLDSQLAEPVHEFSASKFDDLQNTWGWERYTRLSVPIARACLPTQREFFSTVAQAVRNEMAQAVEHLDVDRRDALACSLAVVFSSIIPDLSTFSGWNSRSGVPRKAMARGPLSYTSPFFEAGEETIDRWCSSSATRLRRRIEAIKSRGSRLVSVQVADAAATGLPVHSADVVMWDPVVYDLIDYKSTAQPHELFLESISQVLPIDLVPSNQQREPLGTGNRSSFDKAEYEAQITSQAEEANRVLKKDGRLAVFWAARSPADLRAFLDRVAPTGFELEQALRISRGDRDGAGGSSPRTYVLLLKTVNSAARTSHSQVDAARILELADEGRLALNHGLADILIRRMNEADIEILVPPHLRGSPKDRLAEYVASHENPAELLTEIGRSELREELAERGVDSELWINQTAQQLANLVLEDLGYDVPQAPSASVKDALGEVLRSLNTLQYAQQIDPAQGSAASCFIQIERVLRHSVLAWSRMPQSRSGLLESVLEKHGRQRDLQRLSFGDWQLLFTQVPQALRDENPGLLVFATIARAMKQGRIDEKLSNVVGVRNDIQHDRDSGAIADLPAFIRRVSDAVRQALAALSDLDTRRLLPITVMPQEEVRDRFGRRRLILADTEANRIEIYVVQETDLRNPLIYISSGSNPRDVSPTLLPAQALGDAPSDT